MNYTDQEWEEYCNYLSDKADSKVCMLPNATDEGFLNWKIKKNEKRIS